MSTNELIAKSEPKEYPLEDHLLDVADCTQDILKRNGASEDLQHAGWVAGAFHDFGKANPVWQQNARNNKTLPKHSDLSAYLSVSIIYSDLDLELDEKYKNALILAVLHHHTPWTDNNMKTKGRNRNPAHVNGAMENLKNEISVLGHSGFKIDLNTLFDGLDLGNMQNRLHYTRYKVTENNSETMELAFSIYTALRQADWHESSKLGSGEPSPLPSKIELSDLRNGYDNLRSFQEEIKNKSQSESLMGMAGCGEGKTYSAILWAKKQREKNNIDRLVFAMPTQVTTNNLYTKVCEFSSPDDTSIYHSSAEIFKSSTGSENEEELEEIPSEQIDVNQAELYQAPFNVTTVDHVLNTMASNFDKSPIAYDNLRRSGIVFDEIHAYDEKMVGNILGCIEKCEELGIPYYVMSATIPDKIQTEINPDTRVVSRGSLQDSDEERSPFTVNVQNDELTPAEVRKEITDDTNKLMVVKNTVREAQDLAKRLRETTDADVYYYSSEFTRSDRKKKEKEIMRAFEAGVDPERTRVLVSTQVCEISLDLSADKLLTDIAPIDAVIQRAGRTHRQGEEYITGRCSCIDCENKRTGFKYKVIVYDTTDYTDYIYPYAEDEDSDDFELLEETADILRDFGEYTFSKSLNATTRAYRNYNFDLDSRDTFINSSCSPSNYFKNNSIEFRDILNTKVEVLVSKYELNGTIYTPETLLSMDLDIDEDKDLEHGVGYYQLTQFIEKYSLPIPKYWVYSDQFLIEKSGSLAEDVPSPIYTLQYSYSEGVDPPQKNEQSSDRDHPNL